MKKQNVSIVIPTYNEEKTLPRLLKSIKMQRGVNYEVIVADSNSKDNTKEIASKFRAKVVRGGLPAIGKNRGARKIKYNLILFLDADTKLPKNFLKEVLIEFRERKLDVASVHLVPLSKNKLDHFLYEAYNFWQVITQKIDPHLTGACILIKKKVFWDLGGFDEDLHVAEDMALGRKAKKKKCCVGILHNHILLDNRRLEKEGRLKFSLKLIYFSFRRLFGEIRKSRIKYELRER